MAQVLPANEIIHWRGATDETRPQPGKDKIVVFTEHVTRVSVPRVPFSSVRSFSTMALASRYWTQLCSEHQ